jgi:hypothetical protein
LQFVKLYDQIFMFVFIHDVLTIYGVFSSNLS